MTSDLARHPFDRLRARALLGAMFVTMIIAQIILNIAARGGPPADQRLSFIVIAGMMTLVVILLARRAGLDWRRLFGPRPTRRSLLVLIPAVPLNIGALLTLLAAGSIFIMAPLSYAAPDFVQRYFLTRPPFFQPTSVGQLWLLLLVGGVVAPIVEEVFFRGLLLHRWGRRHGTLAGVIASSALFGLAHQEWVGRFSAGVLFAALYLGTRQLWVPIVGHALTNLLVFVPYGIYQLRHLGEPKRMATIAELRRGLPWAAVHVAIGFALVALYVHLYWPPGTLRAALTGGLPYDDEA